MADAIERNGHYQGDGPIDERCCLIHNPAFYAAGISARRTVIRLIAPSADFSITHWNDSTPTAVVLRTLREMAADLELDVA